MYKIQFIPTGHIFLLPDTEAKALKSKNPDEYLIIEKNGKKFKDKIQIKENNNDSILSQILDK